MARATYSAMSGEVHAYAYNVDSAYLATGDYWQSQKQRKRMWS